MFKALLDMIGLLFGAATNLGGKFVAVILTGLVCFGFWIFQTIRLGLWSNGSIATIAWLALLWLLVWMSASALILHQGVKLAAGLGTLSMAFIVLQTVICWAPGSSKGASLVGQHLDKKALQEAVAATVNVIKPFECNENNASSISYYGQNDAKETVVLIKYARDRKTDRILCFRSDGVYNQTGKPVQDVNDDIIDEIARQKPPVPVVVPPPVQAAQVVIPVAAPVTPITPAPATSEPVVPLTDAREIDTEPVDDNAFERERQTVDYHQILRKMGERRRINNRSFRFRRHHRQYD